MPKIPFPKFKGSIKTAAILITFFLEISICVFFLCSSSVSVNSINEIKPVFIDYNSVQDYKGSPDYLQQPDSNKNNEDAVETVTSHVLLVGAAQNV